MQREVWILLWGLIVLMDFGFTYVMSLVHLFRWLRSPRVTPAPLRTDPRRDLVVGAITASVAGVYAVAGYFFGAPRVTVIVDVLYGLGRAFACRVAMKRIASRRASGL